ncbi:PilZ domain-containing protein [Novosphingobium bradum]|uniref:PilZ domain-containing protein n=1 Tax=Novosphingobium bradum TaxID=1737444 RepID=A0ABV7IMS7_9SPHN
MMKLAREFDSHDVAGRGDAFQERRATPRVTVMIRPAKLIADDREFLCVVRDLSDSGLKLRLFHALPDHERLTIEFESGERHAIRMIWQADELVGCGFVDDVDLPRLIAAHEGPYPRRQPRLQIALDAVLCTGGLRTPITLRDLSQRGAAIDCPGWLMIDELVRIECEVLPTIHAKIRWRRPPRYGVVFEQTFRLEELALACARISAA